MRNWRLVTPNKTVQPTCLLRDKVIIQFQSHTTHDFFLIMLHKIHNIEVTSYKLLVIGQPQLEGKKEKDAP